LSAQDVFDKALFGIRGQGYKTSSTPVGGCKYHIPPVHDALGLCSEPELRCAVGHCIPDAVAKRWDGSGTLDTDIASIREEFPEDYEQFFNQYDLQLLQNLQVIHDTMPDENKAMYFEEQMQQLAQNYGLIYTPQPNTEGS
jgi:hypothetical protein